MRTRLVYVFLHRFFEQETEMAKKIIANLIYTALMACAPLLAVAQHEGHGESHDLNQVEVHHEGADHATHDAHEANGDAHEEHGDEFVAGDFIMHHIADANEIHFWGDLHAPLPMIMYVEGKGLDIFMSSAFHSAAGGHDSHAPKTAVGPSTNTTYTKTHDGITAADENGEAVSFYDISITKSVFGMFLVLIILMVMFTRMARSYAKRPGQAPTGIANVLEPLVLFVRDEIAAPILGKEKAKRFMPFLLTTFFFIVGCNLLGLIPFIGGFNVTGTMGVTIVLAFLVFAITTFSGNKHYWGHLVSPPGVPLPVKFILVPIELFGILLKPIVLMIRLTANISAGHIIILSFVSLIFIFTQDFGVGGGLGIGVFSTLFMIFMYFLELLVAFLQAYVFTLLAAIYFSEATQEPHH